jgi:hypothetical protein
MFAKQLAWTETPCFYVVAYSGSHRAWIAGPYPTHDEAEAALPRAQRWAILESADPKAPDYRYEVAEHWDGELRSILGQ